MTEVEKNLVLLVGFFPSFPPQVEVRATPAAQHQGQQPLVSACSCGAACTKSQDQKRLEIQ